MSDETAAPTSAPPAPVPARSLVKKLAEIMGEVQRVAKSGRNDFHKYDYATEADILDAVRSSMAKRAVILLPSVEKTEWESIPTKSGTQKLCTLHMLFTLEDGESGESKQLKWIGQGADALDKGVYKAMTGAEKYVLLKLFMIPTGDDPEKEEPAERQPQRRPAPQQAQQTTQPRPQPQSGDAVVAQALRSRGVRIWKKAELQGATKETFAADCAKVLGRNVPSAEWTLEDIEKLEKALAGRAA